MTRRSAITGGAVVVVLSLLAWFLPDLRRTLIYDITWWDAEPGDPPPLTGGTGPGLPRAPRTRVVLIDGLSADLAPALASWRATCRRGLTLRVDVGFPTVSLPVETALWTGLTQQQTGIVHRGGGKDGKYGRPLDPPLDRRGIPAQVPDSIAIAEDHGWIVRSLGFAKVLPAAGAHPTDDLDPAAWKQAWQHEARTAVASAASLVFVHILRVDSAGHRHGIGPWYGKTAVEADTILGQLLAADPGARWFLLSDHGHLGGHGGEEREVRQVEACIAGPGVAVGTGPLLHVVDISRAIADSTGAKLETSSHGRPLSTALAAPLGDDQAVPALELSRGVVAIFLLALALGATVWGVGRRWWLAPWWFPIACASLVLVRGEPTMSIGWLYAPEGRLMIETWLPAIGLAAVTSWLGLGRTASRQASRYPWGTTVFRVLAAQLAIPAAALAATITACGAWSTILGATISPLVPHYTAYMLVLVLMVAHGAGAVALAVLARLVRPRFGRRAPAEPPRSEP
jgi:hypothetical protein